MTTTTTPTESSSNAPPPSGPSPASSARANPSWSAVAAICWKDLTLLRRDLMGAFFVFGFPLLIAVFFGLVFGGTGRGSKPDPISVAIVDQDQSAGSKAFVERLETMPEIVVERMDREAAETAVRRGRKAAYIALANDFGAQQGRLFAGEAPTVELGVDPSRPIEAGMLRGLLMQAAFEAMQQTFQDPAQMRAQAQTALKAVKSADPRDLPDSRRHALQAFFERLDDLFADTEATDASAPAQTLPQAAAAPTVPSSSAPMGGFQPLAIVARDVSRQVSGLPRNSFEITFAQGMVWAMIGCAAMFGISFVIERNQGTLWRLRQSPIRPAAILAGKALACFIATVAVTTALLLIGMAVFGVRPDSLPLLALAVIASAVAFVGIMMMLSVVGKTETSASGIGWAVLLVMSMFGGGMVPAAIMPGWMQTIGHLSPVFWAIRALDGAIWRGFSATEMLPPLAILVAIGIAGFSLGARHFRHASTT